MISDFWFLISGMPTGLHWLGSMQRWWIHTLSVVKKDGALMNPLQVGKETGRKSPTIRYWTTVSDHLLINCCSVSELWVDDGPLSLDACDELCARFFAVGHKKLCLLDACLHESMPRVSQSLLSIHNIFMEDKYVVQCGEKLFSLMAPDQSQEHCIKFLKEYNGAKGLKGSERKQVNH